MSESVVVNVSPSAPILHPPRRIIFYHQTHFLPNGTYVPLIPFITNSVPITHLIIAAIHVNDGPGNITLNDDPPDAERNSVLWGELKVLQGAGISVLGMLGGAAKGSFQRLDGTEQQFEAYYTPLRDMITKHSLEGLDLDVEEEMSLHGIKRLIDRLKSDFGNPFTITLAPVATALMGRRHLSGFDYVQLEIQRGDKIAWYNTQFYCGWGSMESSAAYNFIIGSGWKPEKVVIGLLTNPKNAASGHVEIMAASTVILDLVNKHGDIGGVFGWEYFNSLPGDEAEPWRFADCMFAALWGD